MWHFNPETRHISCQTSTPPALLLQREIDGNFSAHFTAVNFCAEGEKVFPFCPSRGELLEMKMEQKKEGE